jgi:tetratricopeptide (TPR) repeat protein
MNAGKRAFYNRDFLRAETHFVTALTRSNRFQPGDPRHAMSLNNLAELYRIQRKFELAEPLFKKALELKIQNLGEEHEDVAVAWNNLALLQLDQSNFEEAENGFVRAIHIVEKNLGPEYPRLATILENYAGLLRAMNRRMKAEEMEARAKVIWATPKLDVTQ